MNAVLFRRPCFFPSWSLLRVRLFPHESIMPPRATDEVASWLPFGLDDFFCIGDRRSRTFQPPGSMRIRPLEGLTFLLPMPLAHETRSLLRVLGGRIVPSVDGATFCIVSQGIQEAHLAKDPNLLSILKRCSTTGVGVVEASWVNEVSSVLDGQDWTCVSVDPHVPPILALLDEIASSSAAAPGPAPGAGPVLSTAAAAASAEAIRAAAASTSRRQGLASSLGETYAFLRREHPEQVDAARLAAAMERSLLDSALALRHAGRGAPPPTEDPRAVLGVDSSANLAAVRTAYRKRALESHPDRGGDPGTFLRVQHAYRRLVESQSWAKEGAKGGAESGGADGEGGEVGEGGGERAGGSAGPALLEGPRRSVEELREHRTLVEAWFARDGASLEQGVAALAAATSELGLAVRDMGATNVNEAGETIYNQCFYLSLARAFLRDDGRGREPGRQVIAETALHFKRVVEAAVLRAHPEWADHTVGEDLQAFSDFLFFVLGGANALLSELCVAVFDSVSGGVEVYKGKHYPDYPGMTGGGGGGGGGGAAGGGGSGGGGSARSASARRGGGGGGSSSRSASSDEPQRANLLCIKYVPGHYQALVATSGVGPTLAETLQCLDLYGVTYVVTDG